MSTPKERIDVLHVDDEPDLADLVAQFLEQQEDQMHIRTETSPEAGLELLNGIDIDCIVSDYDMPGQNGIEFLREVREEYPNLPFILYTGKGSEAVASEAISAGVTDYLQKESGTSQYEVLANRIQNAVEGQRAIERAEDTEEWSSTLLEYSSDYVFVVDEAGDVSYISPSVTRVLGYDPDELTGTAAFDLVHPDDVETAVESFAEILDRPDEDVTVEFRAEHSDGSHRWLEVRGRNLVDDPVIGGVLVNARDITERKERERRYDAIFNQTYQFTGLLEPDGTLIEVNETALEFGNLEREEVIGKKMWDAYWFQQSEETRARAREAVRRAADGEFVRHELPVQGGDGEVIIDFSVRPITNEQGEVTLLVPEGRDITDLKEREQELQLFRAAVESAGHSIYFTDTDGTIEYVNPAFEEITGYTTDEAIGRNPRILKSGEHEAEFYEELWDTILAGDIWRDELINTTKSGDRYVVDQTIGPVKGDSGEIDHFVAVNVDVTERKEYERELERHEAYLEHSHDIITVVDADGTAKFQSESTEQITGYSPKTIEGESGFDHIHPEDREKIANLFASVVDQPDEVASAELRVETPDDSWRWIEARGINKLHDEVVSGIVVSSRDITDRKEHEHQLERQNQRLDDFASVLSHDLRNPLNVAQGQLELAGEECDSEHFEPVDRAHRRMESLIEDLLTLAREGKAGTDREPVDLSPLLKGCWTNVNTENATIVIDIDRTIQADESRLQQMFENLFRNAIEHGSEDVTVTVGELAGGFYVGDDGPGIPPEDREKIFKAGYSTSDEGTGLGLSIIKEIIEAHDWDIMATEGAQGGARFEITDVEFPAE